MLSCVQGQCDVQAKATLPKPAGDLKSKIKNTPSATMGLSFELADLQGQNNKSQNYPSPGKGFQPAKPSATIGDIPDKASPPGPGSLLWFQISVLSFQINAV